MIDRKCSPARLLAVALVAALMLAWTPLAEACPSCKEAISSNGGNVVAGYFYSILFMMSMPFALIGGFSGYMYYEVRKARARQAGPGDGAGAADKLDQ